MTSNWFACPRSPVPRPPPPADFSRQNAVLWHELVVFVIATTGQGDMPQNALSFWKSLLRKKLPPACLSQLRFTTFGLGDSTYPK